MAKKIEVFASEALPGELEDFPDIKRGWGTTKESTGGVPPMKWFNAVQKRTDEWLLYLTQRGVPEWDTSIDYPKSSMVMFGDNFYVSKKETEGETPSTSQAAWRKFSDFFGIDGKLAKDQNGSDIPNKPKFIENLGLGDAAKSNVTQTTGTSTTNVMSQKAVTDLANTKQPKGNYADGGRFQVGSNNTSVTPPGGTYSFEINDSGEIFLWDGSKSVFRVSVSGEITLGSMDYSRLKNVPLVQTTGNSTTSFMSQKATSDLLIAAGELRDVIGQRKVNNTYINSSSRPRFIIITGDAKETGTASVVVNGITIQGLKAAGSSSVLPFYCSFFVPIGGSYRLNSTGIFNLGRWTELS